MELLKNGRDKRALKLAKRKVRTGLGFRGFVGSAGGDKRT